MPLITPQSQDAILPVAPMGQHDCRLEWNSTTTVRLVRYGGQHLMIGGKPQVIPAAGIVRATPLTDANFLVFAYMETPTTMNIWFEAAGTGFANDAYGMPVINGQSGWTLVGIIWAQSPGIDGPRLVCSYWNRKWHAQAVAGTPAITQTSATDTGLRLYGVGFTGDVFYGTTSGSVWHTVANALVHMDLRFDDAYLRSAIMCSAVANGHTPFGVRRVSNLISPGLHSVVPFVHSNVAGTAQWYIMVGLGRWC